MGENLGRSARSLGPTAGRGKNVNRDIRGRKWEKIEGGVKEGGNGEEMMILVMMMMVVIVGEVAVVLVVIVVGRGGRR